VPRGLRDPVQLVTAGCSWGGFVALAQLLEGLPSDLAVPVVAVLHRAPDAAGDPLVEALARHSALPVREVDDKDQVAPGVVHVAPADYHLLVTREGFELSVDEPVRFSRPSIDVLFESAADEYRAGVLAVLLTGANEDGTAGLRRIREAGGYALVQDPATAARPEMPRAAIRAGLAAAVLPFDEIAAAIARLCAAAQRGAAP
jgi:two-component system, chemotaxis family, protein-glutamate methylesterase/glutaminase